MIILHRLGYTCNIEEQNEIWFNAMKYETKIYKYQWTTEVYNSIIDELSDYKKDFNYTFFLSYINNLNDEHKILQIVFKPLINHLIKYPFSWYLSFLTYDLKHNIKTFNTYNINFVYSIYDELMDYCCNNTLLLSENTHKITIINYYKACILYHKCKFVKTVNYQVSTQINKINYFNHLNKSIIDRISMYIRVKRKAISFGILCKRIHFICFKQDFKNSDVICIVASYLDLKTLIKLYRIGAKINCLPSTAWLNAWKDFFNNHWNITNKFIENELNIYQTCFHNGFLFDFLSNVHHPQKLNNLIFKLIDCNLKQFFRFYIYYFSSKARTEHLIRRGKINDVINMFDELFAYIVSKYHSHKKYVLHCVLRSRTQIMNRLNKTIDSKKQWTEQLINIFQILNSFQVIQMSEYMSAVDIIQLLFCSKNLYKILKPTKSNINKWYSVVTRGYCETDVLKMYDLYGRNGLIIDVGRLHRELLYYPMFMQKIKLHLSLVKNNIKHKHKLTNIIDYDTQHSFVYPHALPGGVDCFSYNGLTIDAKWTAVRSFYCFENAVYCKDMNIIYKMLNWLLFIDTTLFCGLFLQFLWKRIETNDYRIIVDKLIGNCHDECKIKILQFMRDNHGEK